MCGRASEEMLAETLALQDKDRPNAITTNVPKRRILLRTSNTSARKITGEKVGSKKDAKEKRRVSCGNPMTYTVTHSQRAENFGGFFGHFTYPNGGNAFTYTDPRGYLQRSGELSARKEFTNKSIWESPGRS